MPEWQLGPLAALGDDALALAIVARFEAIRDAHFAGAEGINPALPVEVRALRRTEDWRVMLLLTPWMLARLFVPARAPGLPVPDAWAAAERAGQPYAVIGPAVKFTLLGAEQPAHLNYDAALGHYLVQPLVQTVWKFDTADAVFAAWNEVIATRQRVMEETRRECPWQRELSRREFFARLAGSRG